jgi:hypothetical protein
MSNGNDPDRAHAIGLAAQLEDQFIQQKEAEARVAQREWIASGNTGLSPRALTIFGNRAHPTMDATSPEHEGYQPWTNCWPGSGWKCISGGPHAIYENPFRYSGERKTRTINDVRQAFQDTFGFFELMHAIDGLTPSVHSTIKPCGQDGQTPCP